MENFKNQKGISFPFILGLLFLTLKLTHVITWSWWLVLLPFYFIPVLLIVIFVIIIIIKYRSL